MYNVCNENQTIRGTDSFRLWRVSDVLIETNNVTAIIIYYKIGS